MGTLAPVTYLVTFLEGVVTFVSPCLLPMLPLYLAYFAGGGGTGAPAADAEAPAGADGVAAPAGSAPAADPTRALRCALGFVLGFGLVFVTLGALSGTLGAALLRYQRAVEIACGLVVILLGLNYLGVLRFSLLDRTLRPQTGVVPRGFASSVAFGVVFAIGWTPCVGTFLASALSLAATSGSAARGVALLACYAAGLGLPFVLAAVALDRLEGAFGWVRAHYDLVNRASGDLLVALGLLMATGLFGSWLRLLAG